MNEQIQISLSEYESMKEELALLKNTPFLQKMNRFLDLLFEEKYGLYLGNNTEDVSESVIRKSWNSSDTSAWDHVPVIFSWTIILWFWKTAIWNQDYCLKNL